MSLFQQSNILAEYHCRKLSFLLKTTGVITAIREYGSVVFLQSASRKAGSEEVRRAVSQIAIFIIELLKRVVTPNEILNQRRRWYSCTLQCRRCLLAVNCAFVKGLCFGLLFLAVFCSLWER